MITFVVNRYGRGQFQNANKGFEYFMEMWKWLEENYGKCSYDQSTWGHEWHNNEEELVRFKFYDESIATWFKLKYPEQMTLEEYERYEHQIN